MFAVYQTCYDSINGQGTLIITRGMVEAKALAVSNDAWPQFLLFCRLYRLLQLLVNCCVHIVSSSSFLTGAWRTII